MVAEHNITYETPEQKRARLAAERDAKHAEAKRRIAALKDKGGA